MPHSVRPSVRIAACVCVAAAFAACSDTPGTGGAGDLDSGSDAADVAPDTSDVGALDSGPDAATDADASIDTDGPSVDCETSADCDEGLVCVDLVTGPGGGLCTTPCIDDAQCPSGSDCVLIVNTGSDGVSVCVPDDYCFDGDGDEFGDGPGCLGADCDDEDENVRPGATELCDGVDNDCDSVTDESTTVEGTPCDTGALGVCGAGLGVCTEGVPDCAGPAPVGELCNDEDDDCNGLVDELSGCVADGGDCTEDADCSSGLCVDGVCVRPVCDAIGCHDRAAVTQGGDRVETSLFTMQVSFGAPVGAHRLATSRYRAAVGVGSFVRSE
jgi:hypothetical protein